jgi:medium-chain acyl-[acyl-carrier-protein] hydrolase
MRKLICFQFAGAGASLFRPWANTLADALVVVAVQLPGRENRFAETPYTRVEQAIDDLDAELDALLEGTSELTLFGHSLGAVLAYERVARRSRGAGPAEPACRQRFAKPVATARASRIGAR